MSEQSLSETTIAAQDKTTDLPDEVEEAPRRGRRTVVAPAPQVRLKEWAKEAGRRGEHPYNVAAFAKEERLAGRETDTAAAYDRRLEAFKVRPTAK